VNVIHLALCPCRRGPGPGNQADHARQQNITPRGLCTWKLCTWKQKRYPVTDAKYSVPIPRSPLDGILHALRYDQANLPFVWGHRIPPLLLRLASLYPPDYFQDCATLDSSPITKVIGSPHSKYIARARRSEHPGSQTFIESSSASAGPNGGGAIPQCSPSLDGVAVTAAMHVMSDCAPHAASCVDSPLTCEQNYSLGVELYGSRPDRAVNDFLNEYHALLRYLEDGRIPSIKITEINQLLPGQWKPSSSNTSGARAVRRTYNLSRQ
jgi:hypothetical protein